MYGYFGEKFPVNHFWELRALAVLRNQSEPRFKASCPLGFARDCHMSSIELISHNIPNTIFFLTEIHYLFLIENQILFSCLKVQTL